MHVPTKSSFTVKLVSASSNAAGGGAKTNPSDYAAKQNFYPSQNYPELHEQHELYEHYNENMKDCYPYYSEMESPYMCYPKYDTENITPYKIPDECLKRIAKV